MLRKRRITGQLETGPNQTRHPHGRLLAMAWAGLLAALALVAGCSETSDNGAASGSSTTINERDKAPEIDPDHPVVRIDTNVGPITVTLNAVESRVTVHNFLSYVQDGFYEGTLFHYVDPGQMIVGGGYTADGQLKQARRPIRNEAHNGLSNKRGTIAMARDPGVIDSATCQFFINLVDAPHFNHQGDTAEDYGYCVFGDVSEGLDVAEKISNLPTEDRGGDLSNTPQTPVVIKTIEVLR